MSQWWSWILAAIGVTGLFLAGSKRTVGWTIGLGAQVLWVAYAIVTQQWGFIASALAYGAVYARNWWRWSGVTAEWLTEGTRHPRPAMNEPEPQVCHFLTVRRRFWWLLPFRYQWRLVRIEKPVPTANEETK